MIDVGNAISLEVPVIGSDIRRTRELLEDGCGLLVPTGDAPRLREAMMHVLNDPEEARAMGRRGAGQDTRWVRPGRDPSTSR